MIKLEDGKKYRNAMGDVMKIKSIPTVANEYSFADELGHTYTLYGRYIDDVTNSVLDLIEEVIEKEKPKTKIQFDKKYKNRSGGIVHIEVELPSSYWPWVFVGDDDNKYSEEGACLNGTSVNASLYLVEEVIQEPKIKYPRRSEQVNDRVGRLKTPGGWLIINDSIIDVAGSMIFLPDANHEWELEDKE